MLNHWIRPPYWELYSKKVRDRLIKPRFLGQILPQEAEERGMRLVTGADGDVEKGIYLHLYWLVDESDGVVAEARFQAIGPTSLLGAAEIVSEWVLRKHYQKASRLTTDLLDRFARDRTETPAFPEESAPFLNAVLSAVDLAVQQCSDLPLDHAPIETPIEEDSFSGEGMEGWLDFSQEQKVELIERILDSEIRPYIELDAGGIQLKSLCGNEVRVIYEGACTSCYSATGSTLNAIQKILKARLHLSLIVIPEFESLNAAELPVVSSET